MNIEFFFLAIHSVSKAYIRNLIKFRSCIIKFIHMNKNINLQSLIKIQLTHIN